MKIYAAIFKALNLLGTAETGGNLVASALSSGSLTFPGHFQSLVISSCQGFELARNTFEITVDAHLFTGVMADKFHFMPDEFH